MTDLTIAELNEIIADANRTFDSSHGADCMSIHPDTIRKMAQMACWWFAYQHEAGAAASETLALREANAALVEALDEARPIVASCINDYDAHEVTWPAEKALAKIDAALTKAGVKSHENLASSSNFAGSGD
jgi:hypothetical protein